MKPDRLRERYETLRRRVHRVGMTSMEWAEFDRLRELLGEDREDQAGQRWPT